MAQTLTRALIVQDILDQAALAGTPDVPQMLLNAVQNWPADDPDNRMILLQECRDRCLTADQVNAASTLTILAQIAAFVEKDELPPPP